MGLEGTRARSIGFFDNKYPQVVLVLFVVVWICWPFVSTVDR